MLYKTTAACNHTKSKINQNRTRLDLSWEKALRFGFGSIFEFETLREPRILSIRVRADSRRTTILYWPVFDSLMTKEWVGTNTKISNQLVCPHVKHDIPHSSARLSLGSWDHELVFEFYGPDGITSTLKLHLRSWELNFVFISSRMFKFLGTKLKSWVFRRVKGLSSCYRARRISQKKNISRKLSFFPQYLSAPSAKFQSLSQCGPNSQFLATTGLVDGQSANNHEGSGLITGACQERPLNPSSLYIHTPKNISWWSWLKITLIQISFMPLFGHSAPRWARIPSKLTLRFLSYRSSMGTLPRKTQHLLHYLKLIYLKIRTLWWKMTTLT